VADEPIKKIQLAVSWLSTYKMAALSLAIFFLLIFTGCDAQAQDEHLPVKLSAVTIKGCSDNCPSAELSNMINGTKGGIRSLLKDTVIQKLNNRSHSCSSQQPCSCSGKWNQIAFLNMSDSSEQCPPNWRLFTTPVRRCGRVTSSAGSCNSATFASNGRSYSHVCGQVNAYQKGSTNAFNNSVSGPGVGLESNYIDGVSLTHGAAGSRQHIWSFAAAWYEEATNLNFICSCTNNKSWPYVVPSFVGIITFVPLVIREVTQVIV